MEPSRSLKMIGQSVCFPSSTVSLEWVVSERVYAASSRNRTDGRETAQHLIVREIRFARYQRKRNGGIR